MKPITRDFKTLVVAGGCFWGVEEYYRRLKGIVDTSVGYANGTTDKTNYREVCTGKTGHVEAVMLYYNPATLNAVDIVNHLFRMIDPTALNRQGNDIGTQYRTGVYTNNLEERAAIQTYVDSRRKDYPQELMIEVSALNNYMVAEPEHQTYLATNPNGYCHIDFSNIRPEELKD